MGGKHKFRRTKRNRMSEKNAKNKYSSKFYILISRDFKHLSSVSPVVVATRWSEALPSVRHGLWPYNDVDSRGNRSRTNEHRNARSEKISVIPSERMVIGVLAPMKWAILHAP